MINHVLISPVIKGPEGPVALSHEKHSQGTNRINYYDEDAYSVNEILYPYRASRRGGGQWCDD